MMCLRYDSCWFCLLVIVPLLILDKASYDATSLLVMAMFLPFVRPRLVPYRDSMLTRLLAESQGPQELRAIAWCRANGCEWED